MLQKEIELRLSSFRDIYLDKDLFAAKAIKKVAIEGNTIKIDIVLGYPLISIKEQMVAALKDWLQPISQEKILEIQIVTQIDPHVGKQGIAGLPQVKNIIAVASGKGGVGKSTVAVNLALALSKEGAQVGLLDADIYGPSQPTMLGTSGKRPVIQDRTIQPLVSHGIQSISIGNLVDGNAAMVWRGPMLGKALEQLMHDTQWKDLDYLIVDLPPGTGDVQLTLCQKIPVSGAVIVTTPQDLALLDVRRACEMFNKLNVPILGIIENMSIYHCPECGHESPIFGEGGALKLANEYQLSLLGKIPLDAQIREITDSGKSLVHADSSHTKLLGDIARKVAGKLAGQTKDYSAKFPKVVVESKR